MFQPSGSDIFLRNRFDHRQIEADALQMGMALRDFDAEQTGRAADVAKGLVF